MRILLSDRAADITTLPTITAGAPLQFDAVGGLAGYVVGAGRPPVATSPGPEPLVDAVDGTSLTRVSAIDVANQRLTIQTAATSAGPWNTGVPNWMKQPAANVLARVGAFNLPCTGIVPGELRGCDTATVLNQHPAYANGTAITITRSDGTTFNVNTNVSAAVNNANSAIISVALTAAQITQAYPVFARGIFVGEDLVYCTGFRRAPSSTDLPANVVSGCTWPAGATINVNDPVYTGATTTAGTPLLNGFIKIEMQDAAGVWSDVTLELLNLGFAAPNQQGDLCDDPTPNAVIRFMRLRDNGHTTDLCDDGTTGFADYGGSLNGNDYWPNMLFDAREGWSRELTGANANQMHMGGLFSYVAFDANNFRRWVAGTIGATGNQALNNNGYIIYFSDRRGDHDETLVGDPETGEYGNEDSINPVAQVWAKNNVHDVGENFNESVDGGGVPTLQMYGETPHPLAVPANAIATMGFTATQRPWTSLPSLYSGRGRLARPVLFRRALKIINGGIAGGVNSLPASGITVTAENPIYIQGNWNATAGSVVAEPNVPTAIIGDSITLLSNAFNDAMTFQFPNTAGNRVASDTGYRFAMVTGKTIPFPKPDAWGVAELGSDGGVHNFMKMLENWGGRNLRYRGSMVSLYYSRQAIGIYRADGNIYSPPTRGYNFDSDFLSPPLLPPGTPMFRDINTLKFRQILRPNQ